MPDPIRDVDVAGWVERVKADPVAYAQRRAAEITLNAIAMTPPLNAKLYLKGGVLMGLAYDSPRQTSDIDLTTSFDVAADIDITIRDLLDGAFPRAAAALGYADLVLKFNSIKKQPRPNEFETASFPALTVRVGFAKRGSKQEDLLKQRKAVDVIDVDISFHEPTRAIEVLNLTGGEKLLAYGLVDLMAEKYRAMLQQVSRNRNRRQDVYDLHMLIASSVIDAEMQADILAVFLDKCRARHIDPTHASLDDPEVKRRSGVDWDTLKLELGAVPEFERCYERVRVFYHALPWRV